MKKYLIFTISCVITLVSSAYAVIPQIEREALIALYNATGGDNWVYNHGWKTPPLHTDGFALPGTESNWIFVGVTQNSVNDLRPLGVTGEIPPEIGNLTNLKELHLFGSELIEEIPLTGEIPPEIGNLTKLEVLFLGSNQLTGEIPPEIGNLTNLKFLWLGSNQLTGEIPPEIGNLTKLETLFLASNQLTGEVPDWIDNLTNLIELYLSSNQ